MTWQTYETGLEERLTALHLRIHRGAYRAHPSRRVYISKPDGRQCPLGIAALEDTLVQQAVVTILTQIDEADVRGFSDGFRPGRSPYQALDALAVPLTRRRVNDVRVGDMRGCCDTLSHAWVVQYLQPRVADPRVIRLIQTWLRAGESEEGQWSETTVGGAAGGRGQPAADGCLPPVCLRSVGGRLA